MGQYNVLIGMIAAFGERDNVIEAGTVPFFGLGVNRAEADLTDPVITGIDKRSVNRFDDGSILLAGAVALGNVTASVRMGAFRGDF